MSDSEQKPRTIPNAPVDWKAIPEIKADLDVFAFNRELDDGPQPASDVPNTGYWFRGEVGTEYVLKVRVTDPDLAQLVISSMYGPHSRIPGMEITEVSFNPEAQKLQTQAEMLRNLADELEAKANQQPYNAY